MVLVSYILNRGYNGSEEGLDAAIAEFEEAIRAEAVEEYLRKSPESIALEASEEIARLQESLEEAQDRLARVLRVDDGDILLRALCGSEDLAWEVAAAAQERLDKYRTTLEEAQLAFADIDRALSPWVLGEAVDPTAVMDAMVRANRALTPSTEAPSEEK